DAPLFELPRLESAFLSCWRTVSYDSDSHNPNSTTRLASSRRVQRFRPSGALEQASAINRAAALPCSFNFCPGRGRSLRQLRFSSTKRLRVRSMVGTQVPISSAISASVKPSSALSHAQRKQKPVSRLSNNKSRNLLDSLSKCKAICAHDNNTRCCFRG